MTTKTCTKCGVSKPLDEYGKRKDTRDGRKSECKACAAEDARRYREANPEKRAERQRRWREANREKIAEYYRRWCEENPEVVAERDRRHIAEYRDLSRAMATVPLRTPWSLDEDALVMADNGMTMFQKAIELGRTYGAVNGRRYHLRACLSAA